MELALIRLSYLQQAIELSAEGTGLNKKKLIEAPLAFRSKAIRSFETGNNLKGGEKIQLSRKTAGAKLIIETDDEFRQPVTSNQQPNGKLTPLDKIRKQYQANVTNGNGSTNRPLQEEELQHAWKDYVLQLREEKNSGVQSFERAILRIKEGHSFEAVTGNNIEKQFIEQDRNRLFSFLKERLQNRLLQFTVIVEEKAGDRPPPEISMTAKEQFLKMTEQYPLVRELKDRLKLELDY